MSISGVTCSPKVSSQTKDAHIDPNRVDDPQYILRLLGQVISVSLETVKIVAGLPELGIGEEEGEEA